MSDHNYYNNDTVIEQANQIARLQAKLAAVAELPGQWRKGAEYSSKIDDPQGTFWQETHADELEALLKRGET